jgi:hypothetical protein
VKKATTTITQLTIILFIKRKLTLSLSVKGVKFLKQLCELFDRILILDYTYECSGEQAVGLESPSLSLGMAGLGIYRGGAVYKS